MYIQVDEFFMQKYYKLNKLFFLWKPEKDCNIRHDRKGVWERYKKYSNDENHLFINVRLRVKSITRKRK